MKILLLAILCLLSHTKAKHLLIETVDSDVKLEAAAAETIGGVGGEDMEEAVEEAVEEVMEKAAEEAVEKVVEEAVEKAAEEALEKAPAEAVKKVAVKGVKEAILEGQGGEDFMAPMMAAELQKEPGSWLMGPMIGMARHK